MLITPNGYEIIREEKPDYNGTVEKAISNGFEDALQDKGRDVDYEFTIETKDDIKFIHCEIKHDNGYVLQMKHDPSKRIDLNEIERNAYQFLLERL